MNPKDQTVVVAMSGGVDSSVAAALLKDQGYQVVGMTMRVWQGDPDQPKPEKSCCSLEDVDDARRVCDILDIPYYALDMKDRFSEAVIQDFLDEYLAGRTPNPCLHCNGEMKFGELLERAEAVGAAKVATGHYARLGFDAERDRWQLWRGDYSEKDQSYALYVLTQAQLSRAMFPLGEMTKADTRSLAKKYGLPISEKVESQDICFVPDGDYRGFLERNLEPGTIQPGNFVDVHGKVLGQHRGVPFYTVGQRRGLGLQGEHRHYVVSLDAETNTVVVGQKHEALEASFLVRDLNWVSIPAPEASLSCQVKIRHRSEPAAATVELQEDGQAKVHLDQADLGIAPGQACVFYEGDLVLGGGTIERPPAVSV